VGSVLLRSAIVLPFGLAPGYGCRSPKSDILVGAGELLRSPV
jgi:hypothetical protein